MKRTVITASSPSVDRDNHGQNASTVDPEDLTLLKALHKFIVPLLRTEANPPDIDELILRSEASKLVSALRNFISSVVESPASEVAKTMVEVGLDSANAETSTSELNTEFHRIAEQETMPISITDSDDDDVNDIGDRSVIIEGDQDDTEDIGRGEDVISQVGMISQTTISSRTQHALESPQYTFEEKLLGTLSEHVFNKMPIRLLSFEEHDLSLRITLLERGAIFGRLEAKLRRRMNQYFPHRNLSAAATKADESFISWLIKSDVSYAILSHTWLRSAPGEVTYSDWVKGRFSSSDPGYQKLVNFCKVAWTEHRLTFGWMDTVCINKESSSELDESIRSMYNWYERAGICIIYLADTEKLSDTYLDRWFTRGWMLQELLAPQVIKFYNSKWEQFVQDSRNDKLCMDRSEMMEQMRTAMSISHDELNDLQKMSLSRRMQLAASREVTREEDTAYSLMGIFSVSISTAYGEGGESAFLRLLRQILESHSDRIFDLFNWAGEGFSSASKILPIGPKQYLQHSATIMLQRYNMRPIEPLTLTHMGIHIAVVLMPGLSIDDKDMNFEPRGEYGATVHISPSTRRFPTSYHLLDNKISGRDTAADDDPIVHQYTFAVFNIQHSTLGVFIPQTCIAIVLRCHEEAGKVTGMGMFSRIETKKPVVFEMKKRLTSHAQEHGSSKRRMVLVNGGIHLSVDDLPKHGMQLISKYL